MLEPKKPGEGTDTAAATGTQTKDQQTTKKEGTDQTSKTKA